ncbi:alpha/beta hydrolase [Telluribacter sp.]|jgi:pimeloyl-ACP methyl ester carboxylesterase|uniref:alpha/beta fold hydrolase n=1 Tax=Telluribacter sp. TaxID=1978767 RepID=UPI002E13E444|nr:alpha/beta hydrolase [Telluribacter sp.]
MRNVLNRVIASPLVLLILLFAVGSCRRIPDIPVEQLKTKYNIKPTDFVAIGGMNVHYRDEGPANDSVPLVLIHGTGSNLFTWNEWTQSLKDKHRIIRFDLPGFGLTGPHPTDDYTQEIYLNFLHSFLQERGVERCILAGNSLGGEITWQYAMKYPDQVKKMILIGAAGYPTQSQDVPVSYIIMRLPLLREVFEKATTREVIRNSLHYLYADTTKVTDSLVTLYYDMTRREGNREALTERMESIGEDGPWNQLPSIKTPTLLIWGKQDRLIPLEYGQRFDKDLPNSTLVVIPNAGHMPMEETPEQSVKAARRFIEEPGPFF